MNKKNISKYLSKVINELIDSVDDKNVKELISRGTIVSGGSIVSLLNNDDINDYDLYFKDFTTCLDIARYFVSKFNEISNTKAAIFVDDSFRIRIRVQSEGVAKINKDIAKDLPKFSPIFLSSNAITLTGDIQLVIRFYGNPKEIHENYDFIHCMNYWSSWDNETVLNEESLSAIINKELVYVGSKYPLCSIIRTRKFIKRGWSINAGQYLKMAFQLNRFDLTSVNVLEDQLMGVDSFYFNELIRSINKEIKQDNSFVVNNEYIIDIINKIF